MAVRSSVSQVCQTIVQANEWCIDEPQFPLCKVACNGQVDLLPPISLPYSSDKKQVGYAELASAVSEAGGLGILTGLTQPTPDDLRKEIRRCRTMTKKPFGVNITLLPSINPPDYEGYAQAVIDEGIKIVETAGNSPGPIIKKLKAANIIILHKCTTIRHAQSASKLGVDFLSIDGFECGGHLGELPVGNFVLLNKARQILKTPFIASGGMGDGYSLAAALSLGACGVNMGTRFMCTLLVYPAYHEQDTPTKLTHLACHREAPIHHNIKQEIIRAGETDTKILMQKFRNSTRLYSNKVANEAYAIETDPNTTEFKAIQPYMSGQRGRQVFINGDVDAGVWTA